LVSATVKVTSVPTVTLEGLAVFARARSAGLGSWSPETAKMTRFAPPVAVNVRESRTLVWSTTGTAMSS
jgi:hypothetical protein